MRALLALVPAALCGCAQIVVKTAQAAEFPRAEGEPLPAAADVVFADTGSMGAGHADLDFLYAQGLRAARVFKETNFPLPLNFKPNDADWLVTTEYRSADRVPFRWRDLLSTPLVLVPVFWPFVRRGEWHVTVNGRVVVADRTGAPVKEYRESQEAVVTCTIWRCNAWFTAASRMPDAAGVAAAGRGAVEKLLRDIVRDKPALAHP